MKLNYYLSLGILLVIAVVIGIFTYNTVWLGDDINYAYDYTPGHNDEVVSSIPQIIKSLNTHYLTTNGRHVPHFFVQAFCGMWGHGAFAVCNAVFYIVFLLALCRLCYVKLGNVRGVITVALLALLTFQTKMTPSCQIGYIWTFSVAMIYLLLFFSHRRFGKWWQLVLLSVFSLIAGNGNEAITLGISGALIIYWCTHMRVMSLRQYLMMAFFGLGTLVICLSPASRDRAGEMAGNPILYVLSMLASLRVSYVMLAIVAWNILRHRISLKKIYRDNSFYFNIWIIMVCFDAVIGMYANRAVFGAELAAIIIAVRSLRSHCFNWLWTVVFSALLVFVYIWQARFIQSVKTQYETVRDEYADSSDGKVYIDLDQNTPLEHMLRFAPIIRPKEINSVGGHAYRQMVRQLHTLYPGKPDLSIVPTVLRGCEDKYLADQVIKLKDGNIYLVIAQKNSQKKLIILRRIDKWFLHREYEPLEVDMCEETFCEGKNWAARYVDADFYTILGLSDNSIELR